MGRCIFLNSKELEGLEATPMDIDIDGNIDCKVTVPMGTEDRLGISNVNGLVVLCEKKLDVPIPPKDIEKGIIKTTTI